MKIIKLDGRHTGVGYFSHYAEPEGPLGQREIEIHKWRTWLWETYGPGTERDVALRTPFRNEVKWAWETHHNCRIFLTPEIATVFTLKFKQ